MCLNVDPTPGSLYDVNPPGSRLYHESRHTLDVKNKSTKTVFLHYLKNKLVKDPNNLF